MLLLLVPLFLMLIFVRWLVAIVTNPTLLSVNQQTQSPLRFSETNASKHSFSRTTAKLVDTR